MTRLLSLGLACCFTVLLTCKSDSINTPEEYLSWIKDPANGVSIKRAVNGFEIEVMYLPSEYLVLAEYEPHQTKTNIDSLVSGRQISGTTFLMHISPVATENIDIIKWGVNSVEEFRDRFLMLNFSVAPLLSLQVDKEEIPVDLTRLENTYNLRPGRNINILFAIPLSRIADAKDSDIDLKFVDELFQTGIHHFVFNRDNLINTPKIN